MRFLPFSFSRSRKITESGKRTVDREFEEISRAVNAKETAVQEHLAAVALPTVLSGEIFVVIVPGLIHPPDQRFGGVLRQTVFIHQVVDAHTERRIDEDTEVVRFILQDVICASADENAAFLCGKAGNQLGFTLIDDL